MNNPSEIAQNFVQSSRLKVGNKTYQTLFLGFQAGAFIAFAGFGSSIVALNFLQSGNLYGVSKFLAGFVFTAGLMMVLIAGGELFTGNSLMSVALLQKEISLKSMLKNWILVYFSNFAGAVLVVFLIFNSNMFSSLGSNFAQGAIFTAYSKVNFSFMEALIRGILCNWLVCIAVWMASAAKDLAGKIFAIFFPILLFVVCGFEHCVANMYYIPAGIFALSDPKFYQAAISSGLTVENLSTINLQNAIFNNLIPVTIGNIIGGAVLVGAVYWSVYLKDKKQQTTL